MDFAEFLKSQGASQEDIKALTEGSFSSVAKKSFEAMQAQIATESTAREKAEQARQKAEETVAADIRWYDEEVVPNFTKMQTAVTVAKANEAKARAAVESLREQGLTQVAKDLGYEPETKPTPPANPGTPGFDSNNYFTRDDIMKIAEREGDAIALAQDIAAEHADLFPGQRLNFRELRREAVAAKKPVEQLWQEKYGILVAREAKAKAEHEAEVAKWKAEGAKEKETELVSRFANPETRPLVSSRSPFAPRPTVGRDKPPWEMPGGDDALSNDRVKRATQNVISKMTQ